VGIGMSTSNHETTGGTDDLMRAPRSEDSAPPQPFDSNAVAATQPLKTGGLAPVTAGGAVKKEVGTPDPIAASNIVDSAGSNVSATVPLQDKSERTVTARNVGGNAYRTSFDCAESTRSDEQAICNDAGLAAMDLELAAAYQNAMETTQARDDLISSQRKWLSARAGCAADLDCLRRSYGARIGQFHQSLGSLPVTSGAASSVP
jgi:uncharacterized protein YecT (DUF1311 family)